MPRVLFTSAVLVCLGLASGCGDSPKAGAGVSRKDQMEDIGRMLKSVADEKRKPPTKLAELEAFEPMMPITAPLIRSGDVVYVWSAEYAPGSNKVAAYEKRAPTEGGWVLLQDGTVKEMSAAEFASAPKAK